MNNKIVSIIIGLGLVVILVLVVFGTKGSFEGKLLPELKRVKELISEQKLDESKNLLDEIARKHPGSPMLGRMYFELASSYEKNNQLVKARNICDIILSKYQNIDNILEVQENVGSLNIKILFSPIITDKDISYTVQPGDTLSKIAKKFGTTIDLIKVSNSLTSDMIRANSKLKVSKARYNILIDKSQNILTLLTGDDAIFKVYKVSTGENNSTPTGTFKIINRIEDPVWYTQGAVVPAESPDNILGSRWLGLSETGYGIHGTIDPNSVGTQATKGCIRMFNSDVEELYTIVPTGSEVSIVN